MTAKKKGSTATGTRTANGRPRRANSKASTSARTTNGVGKAQQQAFSNDRIGLIAGEVWKALTDTGGQSITSLKKSVDAPGDLVVAAVGWLAREEKLDFAPSGRTLKISLR